MTSEFQVVAVAIWTNIYTEMEYQEMSFFVGMSSECICTQQDQ